MSSDAAQIKSSREDALAVVRRLVDAGHVAYFAGGCVRDQLSGREPSDFDVATSAPPEEVRRLLPRSQGVGQAFGVVLVRIGRSQIEVATFRADGHYSDGRRPDDIRFATAIEDAQRRDFTINGLFYDPIADRVIDHVGGREDLAAGILRAIGDPSARFAEDFLRMLRAVRFAARFGFRIEEATRRAILANAEKLPRIAPERIAGELRAMLAAPSHVAAIELLDELTLSEVVFRTLPHSGSAKPSATYVRRLPAGATPTNILAAMMLSRFETLETAFALETIRSIDVELRRLLKLSNDELLAVRTALEIGALLLTPAMPTVPVMKRYLARPYADEGRRLLASVFEDPSLGDRAAKVERVCASFAPETIAPPPFVTGEDLQSLGFRPGPAFKVALDAAYDAQLDGTATSRDAALTLARDQMHRATPPAPSERFA